MPQDFVHCPTCGNQHALHLETLFPPLAETLAALRKRGPSKAVDLPASNIGTTGISNRLSKLHSLGFTTREKQGKFWIYTAKAEEFLPNPFSSDEPVTEDC